MKRLTLSLTLNKPKRKVVEVGCIIWENGVPMRKGNPFPIWDSLPNPLVPPTPRTASTPHPWSERRLKRAAAISHGRYVTLMEVNDLSKELMTADQLLWHEERAAMRMKNTLIAHREWHRKLTHEEVEKQRPKYEALVQIYQEHMHNHKTLNVAFRLLRKWIQRRRAAKLLYPSHHHHNILDMLHLHHEDRSLANLVRHSVLHGLAYSGIHRHGTSSSDDHHYSRTNSDESRLSEISLD